jgi:hypothetical protein
MSDSNDPGTPPRTGPTREAIATVVVTIALLAAFVWYIRPPRADFKPAPLQALPEDCPKVNRAFVPSNITDLPFSAISSLEPQQRLRAHYRMNFEPCTCGCNQSIAECLANHPQCKVCPALAAAIIEKVKTESTK